MRQMCTNLRTLLRKVEVRVRRLPWTHRKCGIPVRREKVNGCRLLVEYPTGELHSCVMSERYAPKEAKCV